MHGFLGMKVLFLVGLFNLFFIPSVSALTYQQDIGVNFTFNTALRLTLSSADIHIYNLAPGTASDSNIINVNVLTNSVSGYTLNATVGNDTTYNTRNLVHTNSSISDNFTSIDYTDSPTITTNTNIDTDKWAFSFSIDNGTNWSNYNGLPLYSDTENIATLKETNGPVSSEAGDDIKFKIAAKASDTKPAGDYSNVINFTLVAAPAPISLLDAYAAAGKQQFNGYYKMQDMNSNICDLVEAVDEQLQVIDVRDGKTYWIAKLQDGNCWMTQNLDLDLDTNKTLTHADTDLGWGSDTATQSWKPDYSTIISDNGQISGYSSSAFNPRSVDPGDYYYAGYDGENLLPYTSVNYLTTTNEDYFKTTPYAINGTHGHVGNYYNWSAAVASNDTSGYTTGYSDMSNNPQNSICPAGWRLPTVTSNSPNGRNAGSKDEFTRLAYLYSGHSGSSGMTIGDSTGMEATPLYFVRSGYYHYGVSYSGANSEYLSSVMRTNYYIYIYESSSGRMVPGSANGDRTFARSLRCVVR